MVRFCEVLRYAQAGGGAVVINAPINQMNRFDQEGGTLLPYAGNGDIQQTGRLSSGFGWHHATGCFNKDTIKVMSHFRTIFTNEELDSYIKPDEKNTNEVYKDGHQWVGPSHPS